MENDYSISVFDGRTNNNGNAVVSEYVRFDDWSCVINYLRSQKEIYSKNKSGNTHIVSGITETGLRIKGSFEKTSQCYFTDIDDMQGSSLNQFYKKYKFLNHDYVVYNSYSCKEGDIRMRIVFNLDRPVLNKEFLHFWTNLNRLYGCLFDPQTNFIEKTNASPRNFEGSLNFLYVSKGSPVNVDMVKSSFGFVCPFQKQRELEGSLKYKQRRAALASSNGIRWSGVNDCPFIPRRILQEYDSIMNTDGTGRFDLFYRIMCVIALNAFKKKYPLSETELKLLMDEIDSNHHQRITQKSALQASYRNAITWGVRNC